MPDPIEQRRKDRAVDAQILSENVTPSFDGPEIIVPLEEGQDLRGKLGEAKERLENLLQQSSVSKGRIIFRWPDGKEEVHGIVKGR